MTRSRRAFTLLELLVVIAIISVLVVFVVISLKAVRASATRADSIGALRQMALGYASYSGDHSYQLMPGYIDAAMLANNGVFGGLQVAAPDGTVLDDVDVQSYVWRLAPYLDDAWETFFTDLNDAGIMSLCQTDYGSHVYGPANGPSIDGGISERPAYGMNSIFVGGDSTHGGTIRAYNPWQNSFPVVAATRTSQVKNPTRLIVFGPAAKAGGLGDVYETLSPGFCELRAPFTFHNAFATNPQDLDSSPWLKQQWCIGGSGEFPVAVHGAGDFGSPGGGLPALRSGDTSMPVAHLDGSTGQLRIRGDIWVSTGNNDLVADMSRWYAFQVGLRDTDTSDCN